MKKIIIANWKCNPNSFLKARNLFYDIKKIKTNNLIVICPSFVHFNIFKFQINNKIKAGAQDVFYKEGAFTGKISASMLKDYKIKYVIIGHSEIRALGETDEQINKKIKSALDHELIPILCVGEKKDEDVKKILESQLKNIISKKIIIAYEPVWAIGTGKFCSSEKANKVLEFIKKRFKNKIIYGGSVNGNVIKNYSNFDGVLVGSASLNSKEFIKIVKNV